MWFSFGKKWILVPSGQERERFQVIHRQKRSFHAAMDDTRCVRKTIMPSRDCRGGNNDSRI
jgi:hypothetical protein